MVTALTIAAFLVLLIVGLIGVGLALLTLPGTWLILAAGIVLQFLTRELARLSGHEMPWLFDNATLWTCAGIALVAEIVEFVASAIGTKRAGGGKSGALFSILGGLVGGILGGLIIPIVGAIPGGVVGAGVGALLGERGVGKRSWRDAFRIGQGAAAGRLVATVAKGGAAGLIAIILLVAVWA